MDRKGKKDSIAAPSNNYRMPRLSPDGTRLAVTVPDLGGNLDIWIWSFARENLTRLTFDEATDRNPLWTPDGKRIAFFSAPDGKGGIYWMAADGTGKPERLSGPGLPSSWSGDGKTVIVMDQNTGNYDIGALSMECNHEMKPLLQNEYNEAVPQISPDGKWMAYASDESGRYEVYVRPFPEVDKGKSQVSTSGGDYPIWSRDGRELFYRTKDAVMAVAVRTDRDFNSEKPEILFSTSAPSGYWDVSRDGKRFLMIEAAESAGTPAGTPAKINVVLNWTEELKQRVPVK